MDYKTFENYIRERNGEISIPEVQCVFKCTYAEVKKAFELAVANNLLVYRGGTLYEINNETPLTWRERMRARLKKNPDYNVNESSKNKDGVESDLKSRIKDFIEQRKTITIPGLQQEFSLEYVEIYKIISELVEENFISFGGGLEYNIIPKSEGNASEERSAEDEIAERRAYLIKKREELIRRFSLYNKSNNDDEDDEDDGDIEDVDENGETDYFDDNDDGVVNNDFDVDEDSGKENKENGNSEESKPKFEDFFYTEDTPHRNVWAKRGLRGRIHYFNEDKFQKIYPDSDNDDIDDDSDRALDDSTESFNYSDDCTDENDYDLPKRRLLIEEYKRQQDEIRKKEDDNQLQDVRKRLLNVVYNISVAQDDDRRLLNGSKYSKEYIDAVGCGATINRYLSNKLRITIKDLIVAERFPFSVILLYNGNKTCLTDDGRVLYFLEERLGKRRAREKLENHTSDKPWIYCENDKLFVPTDIKSARQDVFNMYFALRALLENF